MKDYIRNCARKLANGCIIKSLWTVYSYRDSTVRMIYEIY